MKAFAFVDTDISLGTPGAEIDDGAALIMLLRSPDVKVLAAGTVAGNVSVDQATHNLRRLLAYLGRPDVPTGKGAACPLVQDPSWFVAWRSRYGRTPPWPHEPELPAAAHLLIETVRARPGQVTLLALGPLTNLALAARLAPDIAGKVREVVAMGGSFARRERVAEFNGRYDPEALHIVLNAGWPLRLLGLDVTRQVLFSRHDFGRLPGEDPALELLRRQAAGWIDVVEAEGWESGGCALHDAVAVAALLDETLFDWRETAVSVELTDPQRRGATHFAAPGGKRPFARVAVGVDVARCFDLIWSLLSGEGEE